jgi:hypothetical protein
MTSVFAQFQPKAWPYRWVGTLHVATLAGGVPSDPKVAEGWIRRMLGKGQEYRESLIRQQVAETMVERGLEPDKAAEEVATLKCLNGFKRDSDRGLYIEGRQLKAAIKEAVSVAYAAGKLMGKGGKNSWGLTSKGIHGFAAEHIQVLDDRLYLGVTEPSGITQRFVHTYRGDSIQYEEYVEDAKVDFTVQTDHPFTDEQWAMIWLTGEQQGIGASRSQGFGRYEVTRWERLRRRGKPEAPPQPVVSFGELLLQEVRRSAAMVDYLARQVAELSADDLTWGVTARNIRAPARAGADPVVEVVQRARLHPLVVMLRAERAMLRRLVETAYECGLDQEREGSRIAKVIGAVLNDPRLEMRPGQKDQFAVVVAEHLRAMDRREKERPRP